MTSSLERSDLLMNNYLDKKTEQTMNKGGCADEDDNNEQFGNEKWEDEEDFRKNNQRQIKTVNQYDNNIQGIDNITPIYNNVDKIIESKKFRIAKK